MAERVVESFEAPLEQEMANPNNVYKLRLSKDGSYISDLSKIRKAIRANGQTARLGQILLTDPNLPGKNVKLYVNFAFQPHADFPPCSASIYTLAFGNDTKTWHFSEPVGNLTLPGKPFKGGISGSYASLGFPNELPFIKKENMANAIRVMHSYNGKENPGKELKAGLARMIIATSEAIRMSAVETGMLTEISGGNYQPDADKIRNWGGHKLGDYSLVIE